MQTFPSISSGLLFAELGDHAVVYDLVDEVLHHLNSTAATLLAACDGQTDVADAVQSWASASGADVTVVSRDVDLGIEQLRGLGLIERTSEPAVLAPRVGMLAEPDGPERGAVHAVLDHGIVFAGRDRELIDEIDSFLGTADKDRTADVVFGVTVQPDGGVTLTTDDVWEFPSRIAMFRQLIGVVNEYGARTRTCVSLHAGAVRSPTGEVVVLPGASGSGKSTLTAALVAAGWDYLGDEAIGVRADSLAAIPYPKRVTLSIRSRGVLGLPLGGEFETADVAVDGLRAEVVRLFGDAGPISRVVLPTFVEGAGATLEHLALDDAIDALLMNTLNLGGAGQSGFQALCDLAAQVSVSRLIHGGVSDAVPIITGDT